VKYSKGFITRADALARKAVHDRGWCLRCGRTNGLTAAHVERRRFMSTRWSLDAIICLCLWCHEWFDTHRDEGREWLAGQIGQDALDDIHRRSRMSATMTPEEVIDQIESVTGAVERLSGSPLPGDPASSAMGTVVRDFRATVPVATSGKGN